MLRLHSLSFLPFQVIVFDVSLEKTEYGTIQDVELCDPKMNWSIYLRFLDWIGLKRVEWNGVLIWDSFVCIPVWLYYQLVIDGLINFCLGIQEQETIWFRCTQDLHKVAWDVVACLWKVLHIFIVNWWASFHVDEILIATGEILIGKSFEGTRSLKRQRLFRITESVVNNPSRFDGILNN